MATDYDIRQRLFAGTDRRAPIARPPTPTVKPEPPPRPPRTRVASLLRSGDATQATNATRSLSEFIRAQQTKWAQRQRDPKRRRVRPPGLQSRDPRLWITDTAWFAWTIDGRLVVIDDVSPNPATASLRIRLPSDDEVRDLLAVDRLIQTVVALDGAALDAGKVLTAYIPHHALDTALEVALARALEDEQARAVEIERELAAEEPQGDEPRRADELRPPITPLKKRRFRPEGNFIIFREPDGDLPDFAIVVPGLGFPEAFEDRRKAERFISKHTRRGKLPDGCKIARVLGAVTARPVPRDGFKLPDEPEELLELIRREPRIVQPVLHAEWVPRFVQRDDGQWHPEEFKIRRTVRHGVRDVLLEEVREASEVAVQAIDDNGVAKAVGGDTDLHERIEQPLQTALRARRGLPSSWRQQIGLEDCGVAPDWRQLRDRAAAAPADNVAFWLRAPIEVAVSGEDRPRFREFELRIDDLASVLELCGLRLQFWLIKETVRDDPRWALPVRELCSSNGV